MTPLPMAYARSCSKLLLGLCGRFLMRPGIFSKFASQKQLRLRMGAGSVLHVRACAHLSFRCGCKYVCLHMRICICVRACMHLIGFTNVQHSQFDPQMWGGPYPSPKMVSLWSSLCLFSVRNRTGGQSRFDPQMWGGPYLSPKMVSLWFSLCSFSCSESNRRKTEGNC